MTRMQRYVQLRMQTRLTEFANCMYAMNANKAGIFEFLATVLTWHETSLLCLLLLIFCIGNVK